MLEDKQIQRYLHQLFDNVFFSKNIYNIEDHAGFYITELLYVKNASTAKCHLLNLCCEEIKLQRDQSQNPYKCIESTPSWDSIDTWHDELSPMLDTLKQQGEKKFEVYLNTVKSFVTGECKKWWHVQNNV